MIASEQESCNLSSGQQMPDTLILQIRFLRPERIIRAVKSVFDTPHYRISSRNQIKTSHFREESNLLCKTPSSGKSSVTAFASQTAMGQQQRLQIWVRGGTQTSHSCSELIWQTQTAGAWWIERES